MLVWMFIMLFCTGWFLVLLSLKYENNAFWNIVPLVLAILVFFLLALGSVELTETYQLFNSTSGNIETGIQEIHLIENTYLTYLFMGIALLLLIYLVAMIYDKHMYFNK